MNSMKFEVLYASIFFMEFDEKFREIDRNLILKSKVFSKLLGICLYFHPLYNALCLQYVYQMQNLVWNLTWPKRSNEPVSG